MNKIVKIALGVVALILLIIVFRWCGNGSSSTSKASRSQDTVAMLKPYSTDVKGYLSDVFEVVDGTYKFEYKSSNYTGKGTIQIKIRSIGKGNTKDYGFADGNDGPILLSICDKNGMPISDFTELQSSYSADDLLKDMVQKVGEENWVEFELNTYQGKWLPSDATGFITTSKQKEKREETSTTSNSSTSSSSSSSSSKEWDKVLDDYEAYMDKYVEAIKKAKNEDPDMLTDLAEMLEQAQDLAEDLQAASNSKSLSSSQINRMMKIQQKLAKAMQQMQ